jgi:hypothetical protein
MVELSVRTNIKQFERWLNKDARKQIPYATSRALNDSAIDAQKAVVENVQKRFKNRKKWWLKQQPTGIKVKFSKKKDLHSRVYTNAYFAKIQEEGGIKSPRSGRNLAIPTDKVPRKHRNSHGARDMVNQGKRIFHTPRGVFKRNSKKRITLLFNFSPTAKIVPRMGFESTVRDTVKKKFSLHFEKRLKQALQSKKPPSLK